METFVFVGIPDSVSFDIRGKVLPIALTQEGLQNCNRVDLLLEKLVNQNPKKKKCDYPHLQKFKKKVGWKNLFSGCW